MLRLMSMSMSTPMLMSIVFIMFMFTSRCMFINEYSWSFLTSQTPPTAYACAEMIPNHQYHVSYSSSNSLIIIIIWLLRLIPTNLIAPPTYPIFRNMVDICYRGAYLQDLPIENNQTKQQKIQISFNWKSGNYI